VSSVALDTGSLALLTLLDLWVAGIGILGFNVPLDTAYVISETGGPEQ